MSSRFELDDAACRGLRRRLLAWYDQNRRALPWRNVSDPYATWVSEIMLQQTRVEVVRDYYARWMERYPTVSALAEATEEDVLRSWQGLGYYSRAKRLLKGARYVAARLGGRLPDSVGDLLEVPGIGPYSAGAISSIAYGKRAPLVDGNVVRVLTRLFAFSGDPTKAELKRGLWSVAEQLVSPSRPGDFNQGLMELGALVCTPKNPSCIGCPLRSQCEAFKRGEVTRYPELRKREAPTALTMVAAILRNQGRLAVVALGAEARWWKGLEAFPFGELGPGDSVEGKAGQLARLHAEPTGTPRALPELNHTVTRYRITLHPFEVPVRLRKKHSGLRWVTPQEARTLALPAPHMKVLLSSFFG